MEFKKTSITYSLTQKQYYHECGFNISLKKRNKWDIQEGLKKWGHETPTYCTSTKAGVLQYLQHIYENYENESKFLKKIKLEMSFKVRNDR